MIEKKRKMKQEVVSKILFIPKLLGFWESGWVLACEMSQWCRVIKMSYYCFTVLTKLNSLSITAVHRSICNYRLCSLFEQHVTMGKKRRKRNDCKENLFPKSGTCCLNPDVIRIPKMLLSNECTSHTNSSKDKYTNWCIRK